MVNVSWPKEERNDVYIKIVLFLLSPLLGFIYSLRTMNRKSSYIVFFLFSVVFGLSFTVSNIRTESSADGISYRYDFEMIRYQSIDEYFDGLIGFLSFEEGGKLDYYFDTIAFCVSRFTNNYHIMFMVFSIVFSYFLLKCLRLFTKEYTNNIKWPFFILAFIFTYNQIFNINGMRFWTAAWIGVYCVFQIIKNNNKKYYLLLVLTPFFHRSFWFFIIVFIICNFTKKFEKIWFVLFILSSVFSSIAVEVISESVNYLPSFLSSLIDTYTSDEAIKIKNAEGTGWWWLAKFLTSLIRLYFNIMICIFFMNKNKIQYNDKIHSLYLFIIPYVAMVNFVMAVPSLGERYIVLAYPILAYIWLVYFKCNKYNVYLLIVPIIFFIDIYYTVLHYFIVLEPCFFFTSPIYLIFKYSFFA